MTIAILVIVFLLFRAAWRTWQKPEEAKACPRAVKPAGPCMVDGKYHEENPKVPRRGMIWGGGRRPEEPPDYLRDFKPHSGGTH